MKIECAKWKDELLEAALSGVAASGLEEHLLLCASCAEELAALCARREQLDSLLPLVARGAEPPPEFRAQVLAAAAAANEARGARSWRVWALAGATAVTAATLLIVLAVRQSEVRIVPASDLAAAEKLAQWRAPSDVLLETPGREILRTTPRLGESYLRVPKKTDEED
jgi:hypothetical protein